MARITIFISLCFFVLVSFGEKAAGAQAKSQVSVSSLITAARLSEKNAKKSRYAHEFLKAANDFVAASKLTKSMAQKDELLVKAASILKLELGDVDGAKMALKPFVTKAKQKELPKSYAFYGNLTGNETKEKSDSLPKLEKIEKVQLIKADGGVGMRLATTGELQIKHGVIPKTSKSPRRVYFDISRAELKSKGPDAFAISKGGIVQLRIAQFKPDIVRVVVETDESMPFQVKSYGAKSVEIWLGKPHALPEKKLEKVVESKEAAVPAGLALRKIVIDPGHGGHDPGAIGAKGLQEKDVTLAISKRLKTAIEEEMPGVKVFLTRDGDKFIPLSERTEFANKLNADLFLSVHVNSSANRNTQGIETYYLNISHDSYAKRLASRENAMSETEISNLEYILADLSMKSNISDSVHLGSEVQSSFFSHMQEEWDDTRDLGLKHALFYVLLGARMPAVLVETAFISNRDDEKRLQTEKYQTAIAQGMLKGIKRYCEKKQATYQASVLP